MKEGMKPTPGPWYHSFDLRGHDVRTEKGVDSGILVAAVGGGNSVFENARLIAAAPELFECVAGFVRRFGAAVECDEEINGCDAVDWISKNMREFRNALKKARGL